MTQLEASRKWRAKNQERVRDYYRTYNNNYYHKRKMTVRGQFIITRQDARRRKLEFNLELSDFEMLPKECFYCGDIPQSAGIDRIDNTKGYIKGNIVRACSFCNLMKHKHSQLEFLAQIKKIGIYSKLHD